MASNVAAVNDDTLITIKISFDNCTKRLKLPLKDLQANVLPVKLRHVLCIAPDQPVVFERFSDSAGGYVVLDSANPAVFKTLVRAAKAKLKLRLRASAPSSGGSASQDANSVEEPVIARTPAPVTSSRDSTALDQRTVGPGIFEFRDAIASQKKADKEAPAFHPFNFTAPTTNPSLPQVLPLRARASAEVNKAPWSVYCNSCDCVMTNVHYHCSICDGGDFDLCEFCVRHGKACPGEGHWLIKRSLEKGDFVSSTTERIAPKPKAAVPETLAKVVSEIIPQAMPKAEPEVEQEVPGAFTDDVKTLTDESDRTCNACVNTFPDRDFVTCMCCEDYDLCLDCHVGMEHGHHPGHHFKPAVSGTVLSLNEEALLPAGRNVRHNALCDGCDKTIFGVRHKCFECPDFDYCTKCVENARHTHPRHRFAAIYDPIKGQSTHSVTHQGIYCDGPLCKDKPEQTYVRGVRYKCVVCHDTDFCEACEALPTSTHNRTHPLVKFKTPVNHLTISTESENKHGVVRKLGDREVTRQQRSPVVPAPRRQPSNVTVPVKTVADIEPSPQVEDEKVATPIEAPAAAPVAASPVASVKTTEAILQGHFVSDRITDGTIMVPNARFSQVWTIRNPGPHAWPKGCSVRFVGGDNMLNVDNNHAAAVSVIDRAIESNVTGREVLAGEQVSFVVTMKAPARVGKAISYWRLKSQDGTPFGHRLWCDIEVKKIATETTEAAPALSLECALPYDQARVQSYYALYKERLNMLKSNMDAKAEEKAKQSEKSMTEGQKSQQATSVLEDKQEVGGVQVKEAEGEMEGSQMVFPTLERESPSSSTYQSFGGSNIIEKAQADVEQASEAPSSTDDADDEEFEDISDDLEVLSANEGEESEDDGFLTDDDYDILDASDQETIASMQ